MRRSLLPEIVIVVALLGGLGVGALWSFGVFDSERSVDVGASDALTTSTGPVTPDQTVPAGLLTTSAEVALPGEKLEIMAQWTTVADIDLVVRQPDQEIVAGKVRYGSEASRTGGLHTTDVNPRCQALGQPPHRESVTWSDNAATGTYQVLILNLIDDPDIPDDPPRECGPNPTEVTVTIRASENEHVVAASVPHNQRLELILTVT